MNMIKASEVIEIFLKYGISNSKDESKYEISELDGITNTSYIVVLDNEKYVLRIPGDNPCLLYTSPSPRDATLSRMPSSA